MKNMFLIFSLVTLFTIIWPVDAHAYIDPGTTSYIIQMLIAGMVGSIVFFRGYIMKIKEFIFKKSKDDIPDNDEN